MSEWDGWGRFPPRARKRPPPAHGVQVARIGATWWGVRWIEALERLSSEYSNRLARGRTYARAGRVHDLAIASGLVSARVTGSRRTPYRVSLRLAALAPAAWDQAVLAMAGQALFAAELLAGRMPQDIDEAFRAGGHSLFPLAARGDLATECSCPDWANPCKHVAATHYVLGEAFDKDPFLLFELRGRGRDDVLSALRRTRAGGEPAPGASSDAGAGQGEAIATVSLDGRDPAELERLRGPIANLRFAFDPPAAGGAVRQLGVPPSWRADETPAELLGRDYRAAAELAREIALAGPTDRDDD
ncbi:MAG TPA: SWIM zinc finger family protein [Kofleriaceae bacterium]|nr:SWIM zinc finger family protein [Kofleriaceae bacterium]